jgi:hypothetical protein
MAIIVALPALHHREEATATAAASPTTQAQTASIAVPSLAATATAYTASDADASLSTDAAQVSRDNRMLRTIHQELEASADTPTALDTDMGLQPASDAAARQTSSLLD